MGHVSVVCLNLKSSTNCGLLLRRPLGIVFCTLVRSLVSPIKRTAEPVENRGVDSRRTCRLSWVTRKPAEEGSNVGSNWRSFGGIQNKVPPFGFAGIQSEGSL